MTTDPAVREERDFALLSSFGPLRQAIRRVLDRELATAGVSLTQVQPLLRIHEYGTMRQRELAQRLEIEGPTLVRLLDQLEAMGLVERRPDPDDHRAKTLHLTDAGESMVAQTRPLLARVRSALLAEVTDEDLEASLRVLASVAAACGRDPAGVEA